MSDKKNVNAENSRLWVKKSKLELEQLIHCIRSLDRDCSRCLKDILELNGDEIITEEVCCKNCGDSCGKVEVNKRDRLVKYLKSSSDSRSMAIEELSVYFSHMPDEHKD